MSTVILSVIATFREIKSQTQVIPARYAGIIKNYVVLKSKCLSFTNSIVTIDEVCFSNNLLTTLFQMIDSSR